MHLVSFTSTFPVESGRYARGVHLTGIGSFLEVKTVRRSQLIAIDCRYVGCVRAVQLYEYRLRTFTLSLPELASLASQIPPAMNIKSCSGWRSSMATRYPRCVHVSAEFRAVVMTANCGALFQPQAVGVVAS